MKDIVATATEAARDMAVRPASKVLDAVADRIASRIRARKPKLNVVFNPQQCFWTIGGEGQRDGSIRELMSIHLRAAFAHDNPHEQIVITEAYVRGAQPRFGTFMVALPPSRVTDATIAMMLLPIKGKKGKPFSSRIILKDQFGRTYRTQNYTFRWAESPLPPLPRSS